VTTEAATRYIGISFFGAFLSLLFLLGDPSDAHNFTQTIIVIRHASVPFASVGTTTLGGYFNNSQSLMTQYLMSVTV